MALLMQVEVAAAQTVDLVVLVEVVVEVGQDEGHVSRRQVQQIQVAVAEGRGQEMQIYREPTVTE